MMTLYTQRTISWESSHEIRNKYTERIHFSSQYLV